MPPYPHIKVPQTFIPCREIKRDLTPAEFLNWYGSLSNIISVAKTDIQTIMHFRGWCAYGASSGPHCVMRKTFPGGRSVDTTDKIAPEIEAELCYRLEAQADAAPTPPPAPARRRRKS
jgi:hypothetical protein